MYLSRISTCGSPGWPTVLPAAHGDDDGVVHGDDVNRTFRAAFVGVVAWWRGGVVAWWRGGVVVARRRAVVVERRLHAARWPSGVGIVWLTCPPAGTSTLRPEGSQPVP
jgi:hypothetical protein